MALRPSIRFDVFKRDGFSCAYCGRKPPAVILEVDHVIPVADGGGDEYENLVTSCWDCNRGKGAKQLDERAPTINVEEQTELIWERERQLRAFHEAKREQAERRESQFGEVWDYWFDLYEATEMSQYHTPWKNSLRSYVEQLGVQEVKEAMEIAHDRFRWPSSKAARYFAGVCKNKLAEQEGRVRECSICHERLVLTREQAAEETPGSTWYHTACGEGDGG